MTVCTVFDIPLSSRASHGRSHSHTLNFIYIKKSYINDNSSNMDEDSDIRPGFMSIPSFIILFSSGSSWNDFDINKPVSLTSHRLSRNHPLHRSLASQSWKQCWLQNCHSRSSYCQSDPWAHALLSLFPFPYRSLDCLQRNATKLFLFPPAPTFKKLFSANNLITIFSKWCKPFSIEAFSL